VEVVVPEWLDLDFRGLRIEARVRGMRSSVRIHTADGAITVEDQGGELDVSTVSGDIRVTDAQGRIQARSVGDEVRLVRVQGAIQVTSTGGDLILDEVDTGALDAQTMDGDVDFSGRLRPGAEVRLVTHDGDVTAEVPQDTHVDVLVSTFDGDFSADFPVRLERFQGGREMRFTLGEGGGRLLLQAFDGEIRLRQRR
jgi:DUF4097 and DUF4098 domain-containing protein YvlB